MKKGDVVKDDKMKNPGVIVLIRKNRALVECQDREDGEMCICASEGIRTKDLRRKLKWCYLDKLQVL